MFYSYTNKWTADKRRGGVISAVITSDQVGVGISFCVFLPGSSQSFVFLIKGKQSKQTPHWIYKSEKWLTTVFISLRSGINYNIMALTQYLNKYCDYCFMSVKKKKTPEKCFFCWFKNTTTPQFSCVTHFKPLKQQRFLVLPPRERLLNRILASAAWRVLKMEIMFWYWSCFTLSIQILKEEMDQDILLESFLSLGRVDHMTMVMALHPAYLSCFLKAQHALLELDGPLPCHWRHYIVLMVRHEYHIMLETLWHLVCFSAFEDLARVCAIGARDK